MDEFFPLARRGPPPVVRNDAQAARRTTTRRAVLFSVIRADSKSWSPAPHPSDPYRIRHQWQPQPSPRLALSYTGLLRNCREVVTKV